MILQLRAKTPDGGWFYQNNQYLTSFLRRVLTMYGVTHPTYLKVELEDLLEINIGGVWVKCEAPLAEKRNEQGETSES